MKNLSNEDMFVAVKEGVKEALLEMLESIDIIRTDQFMEQVRQGVYDAIWSVATNATDMPCADFYDSITKGVEKALEGFDFNEVLEKQCRDVSPKD